MKVVIHNIVEFRPSFKSRLVGRIIFHHSLYRVSPFSLVFCLENIVQYAAMSNKTQDRFQTFFKDYSKNVDKANAQYFWKLLDEIILAIINKEVPPPLKKENTILDAGGGTGRWIVELSKKYRSKFILYDKSQEMLNVAQNKKALTELGSRLEILRGDIQNMNNIQSNSIDCLLSIYNPISFVERPSLFFKETFRVLKPGTKALITGQGFLNAVFSKINNYLASSSELKELSKTKKIKWSDYVPSLNVFTKESFEKLANEANFKICNIYGLPVFIQPGMEDFDPKNQKRSRVSQKLENDPGFYKSVYDLEMKYNSLNSIANRGMNLMIVVQKK
jgi:ubiquinone/menaquinone biosynthesis C-methylase UbiE